MPAGPCVPEAAGGRLLDVLRPHVLAVDAVSFDVLDTLFVRLISRPEDVFDLVGERHGLTGFRALREAAQTRAFQVMLEEGRAEIDLDGVYACLPPVGPGAAALQANEEAVEFSVLRLNPEMAEVLRFARAQGRRVVAMSDMYLPRRFFEALFDREDLALDHLFVSSDRQATKRDHGALFDLAAAEIGLAPDRILHIGDNPHSDVARARERGFQAFHYAPEHLFAGDDAAAADAKVVQGTARFQAHAPDRSAWWRLGFACGGPAALAFQRFAQDRSIEDEVELVLNVARDGHILHRLWPAEAAAPSAYLRTSRTALTLAAVTEQDFDTHLPFLLSGAHGLTLLDVFRRIGVEAPADALLADLGLAPDIVYGDDTHERFVALMDVWRWRILRVCAENRRGLRAYLQQLGVRNGMRVAFTDVGWSGTTQAAFLRATAPFLELDVRGYYLCLRDDPVARQRRDTLSMDAMISVDTHDVQRVEAVYANRVVSELFFSAPHPSVIGHRLARDGRTTFVEDAGRGADPRLPLAAREIEAGALACAAMLGEVAGDLRIELSDDALLAPLMQLALTPTQAQAQALGSLYNFDAWGSSTRLRSFMAQAPEPGEPLRGDAWPAGLAALVAEGSPGA